jgi:hypothetical protein
MPASRRWATAGDLWKWLLTDLTSGLSDEDANRPATESPLPPEREPEPEREPDAIGDQPRAPPQ